MSLTCREESTLLASNRGGWRTVEETERAISWPELERTTGANEPGKEIEP